MTRGMWSYWWDILGFVAFARSPTRANQIPVWALAQAYRVWHKECRCSGRSFEDLTFTSMPAELRQKLPLKSLYLAFLMLWPILALWRALRHREGRLRYWRGALSLPELSIFHPHASFTDQEWRWSRPDFALSMLYAWEWDRGKPAHLRLDDKRYFRKVATAEGFPLPPSFTREEAMARGGEYIVKDPLLDLGTGIELMDADELRVLEDDEEVLIEAVLENHALLQELFSVDAPLSTLRVTTMLNPRTLEPEVSRCAIRIGQANALTDNTYQGGFWSNIDLEHGTLKSAVTRNSFGMLRDGVPIRASDHPATGRTFVGVKVPYWEEGRKLALDAHKALAPNAASIGWDIALASTGPVLLEANLWTVVYDYDPPTNALDPACELILRKLQEGAEHLPQ